MADCPHNFRSCLKGDLIRYRATILGKNGGTIWCGLFSPRFAPVLLHRIAYALGQARLGPLARAVSLVNFTVFGIEIAIRCRIGPGLVFPHTQGTVIGATCLGSNVTVFQGVTLGARGLDAAYQPDARPSVGDDVLIGAGAKVLGGIRLGHRCRVGANAVVLESVPDDAVAVGVPAHIVLPKHNRD